MGDIVSARHGTRGRGAALLVALTLLAAGCGTDAEEPVDPTPEPVPVLTEPTPTPAPAPRATSTPTEVGDDEEARLEELRASRRFIELAEHDRAPNGQWSQFAYSQFGIAGDGGLVGEWTNKRELWDSFVPAFRDECLLAGEPATEPMWDEQLMIPVGVDAAWNTKTTEGRGQFVELTCFAIGSQHPQGAVLVGGVLIAGEKEADGRVAASMSTLVVPQSDFETIAAMRQSVDEHLWSWVMEQDPL
jgi:hypothetical protein